MTEKSIHERGTRSLELPMTCYYGDDTVMVYELLTPQICGIR